MLTVYSSNAFFQYLCNKNSIFGLFLFYEFYKPVLIVSIIISYLITISHYLCYIVLFKTKYTSYLWLCISFLILGYIIDKVYNQS